MPQTLAKNEVARFFDGKVRVYEITAFNDDRGLLAELWREDDEYAAKMCYWSETNPLFMRGPHEHRNQTDCFISYKNQMVYMFYDGKNTQNSSIFITDPQKIYAIFVEPGIIHGYRNISTKPSLTGNFPDQLWKGYGKTEPVDEIRYEDKVVGKPIVVILGAGGRLGKAITNKFFSEMKIDGIQLVPFFEKIPVFQSQSVNDFVEHIMRIRDYYKSERVYVINCIGKTNVADLESESVKKEAFWVNVDLPFLLGEKLTKNHMHFMHFSSDYVYQRFADDSNKKNKKLTKSLPVYTQTKKQYEELLREIYHKNYPKELCVVRVSNLFSVSTDDRVNLLLKLKRKMEKNMIIEYDEEQFVGLTDVKYIADWVYRTIEQNMYFNGKTFINLRSTGMTIKDIINLYFGGYKHLKACRNGFNQWFLEFCNDENVEQIDLPSSDKSIRDYVQLISKNESNVNSPQV